MKSILFLLAVLSLVFAATAQPCTMIPPIWSSGISEVSINSSACVAGRIFGQIYMNFPQQLLRLDFMAMNTVNNAMANLSFWVQGKTNMSYILNYDTMTCIKIPGAFPVVWYQMFPNNSIYLGEVLIGSQQIQNYFFPTVPGASMNISMEASVIPGTCLPVSAVILNTTMTNGANNTYVTATQSYWDAVPQVPPFIFNVPSMCTSMKKNHKRVSHHIPSNFFLTHL